MKRKMTAEMKLEQEKENPKRRLMLCTMISRNHFSIILVARLLKEVKGKLSYFWKFYFYFSKIEIIEIFFCDFRRSQRTDWRTERKLNSETFGVSSMRRGNFRGRGFYNNRGMGGGMYRGGPPGGPGSGYRGGFRGNRGANRKTGNQAHNSNMGNQNRATNEPPSATQPQQNNRLVTGTA